MLFFGETDVKAIETNLSKLIATETNNQIPEKITNWIIKKVSLSYKFELNKNDYQDL